MNFKVKGIEKGTKLYSILKLKCPKCQEGNLFIVPNAWKLKKVLDMPRRCPVCRQDFVVEPGFYTGALWTSYPIVIFIDLLLLVPILFYPKYIILIVISMAIMSLLLQPIIMRWGRAIWVNIFVSYDPNVTNAQ